MWRWFLDTFVYKRRTDSGSGADDAMLLGKQLLAACKSIPKAREHVKNAMREIFTHELEAYDNDEAN